MQFLRPSALLLGLLLSTSAQAKKFNIDTTPLEGGRISVDGKFIGVAPLKAKIKLKGDDVAKITAERDGAVSLWPTNIDKKHKGTVLVQLEKDEAWEATELSDVANTWLTVPASHTKDADGNADKDLIWQKLVSIVTDNFSDLEQMDRSSYYLRTAWRIRDFNFRTVRNRLVIKAGVGDTFSIKVQLESQIADKRTKGQTVTDDDFKPHERVFNKDKETIDFLRDQL